MTITANGKSHIADHIGDRGTYPVSLMAIGTGSPSATALGTEIANSRRIVVPSDSGAVITWQAHWDIEDEIAATITEVGLFNNNGTMIASQSFAGVVKGLNDPFNVTWTLEIL